MRSPRSPRSPTPRQGSRISAHIDSPGETGGTSDSSFLLSNFALRRCSFCASRNSTYLLRLILPERRWVLFDLQKAHEVVQQRAAALAKSAGYSTTALDGETHVAVSGHSDPVPVSESELCDSCSQLLPQREQPTNNQNSVCILCTRRLPEYVSVVLDEDKSISIMHTASLMENSKYFSATLNQGWLEVNTGVFHLEDTSSISWAIFTHFIESDNRLDENADLQWIEELELVRGELTQDEFPQADKTEITSDESDIVIDRLVDCYLLGEYIQSPRFCNSIADLLNYRFRDFLHREDLLPLWPMHKAFSGIRGSGMQRLMADLMEFALSEKTLSLAVRKGYVCEAATAEIALSSFRARERKMSERAPWLKHQCIYHDHPDGGFKAPCDDMLEVHDCTGEQVWESPGWDNFRDGVGNW
ncbi:uncharacterized protein LY89DRAFT_745371 [Mollisia scopiformis]|uniref:BTB domain-containing protein n=1 Tax=Mollisia scopiformis TaxID=149040 RepID=A0A194XXG0_MOLSC|nr:uncharacterized protein LY89DRAFT_745371 [Mollisia scopiformis]KUJ24482.1 hypothetical protein LY89DRAFT_745371 [Mollisia scopiformis]